MGGSGLPRDKFARP
jgi:hypothetical protein